MLNKVFVQGRLIDAPQIIEASTGVRVGTFSVANNIPYRDKETGEWKEITNFLDVKAFNGKTKILEKLQKGDLVLIEGRLQQDRWQKEGKTYTKIWIIAENIQIFKRAKSKTENKPVPETSSKKEKLIQEVEKAIFEDDDLPIDI